MNPETSAPADEQFTSLLIACDEALAAGAPAPALSDADAASDLRPRLERGLACLRLLGQFWPTRDEGVAASGLFDAKPLTQFGRFHIRREVGHGSFGTVFLAYDPELGREVALKIPRVPALVTPELRQRFHLEALAAARLDHPNLVPVYEAGTVGDICFLTSPYCPGITLAAWLQHGEEPVPWRVAAALLATLAEAVQHAHSRGVLHRDLKPANILLQNYPTAESAESAEKSRGEERTNARSGENGLPNSSSGLASALSALPALSAVGSFVPRITDFGLAKLLVEGQPDQTGTGMVVGSPCYMAPEQAEARNKEVTTAADVYALGAILYEMLTGRPPFLAESALATLEQVRTQEAVPPRRLNAHVPRDLERICLKCLEKDPRRRYGSAHGLAEDLRRLLAGEPIHARSVGPGERLLKWAKRRPAPAAVIGVTCLAGALLFVLSAAFNVRLAEKKAETEQALQGEVEANDELKRALEREKQAVQRERAALQRERQAREREQQTLVRYRISLAHHEWLANNPARTEQLLKDCLPEGPRRWEWRYLKRMTQSGFATLGRHPCEVSSVAFDPTGKRLASGSWDWTVKLWDVGAARELFTLRGHKDFVDGVAFSPDGRRLASASRDKTVKVWDVATGNVCYTLGHDGEAVAVAFSPDGRLLASASWDRMVRVWDTSTGRLLHTLKGHRDRVYCVTFSPDGRRLASGGFGVRVWDATTGKQLGTCADAVEPLIWVGGVAFHPDGRRLASANGNKTVYIWDSTTGKAVHVLRGHHSGVNGVCFSPDGDRLASASYDQTVRLWDTASGAGLQTLRGHTAWWVSSVAFAPDGKSLASGGGDKTVRVWDALTGQESLTIPGDLHTQVACSRDGGYLATAGRYRDKAVVVWDAHTAKQLHRLLGHTRPALTVAFRPDGRYLASAGEDGIVIVWDTTTWKAVATLRRHAQGIAKVAYSPDGKRLASAGGDGTVRIWDPASGQPVRTLQGHTLWVNSVAFSPDGTYLASAGADRTVRLWNAATGKPVRTLAGHTHGVTSVAFDPTGKRLASGSRDATIKIWDVATGRVALPLEGHTSAVLDVVFSPDGQRLASGGDDYAVKLWDAATGEEAFTLRGQPAGVCSVAFSPDGTRLLCGTVGMKIWEALPATDR